MFMLSQKVYFLRKVVYENLVENFYKNHIEKHLELLENTRLLLIWCLLYGNVFINMSLSSKSTQFDICGRQRHQLKYANYSR